MRFLIAISIVFSAFGVVGQEDTLFVNSYGTIYDEVLADAIQLEDGSYLMLGTANIGLTNLSDFYLVKLDADRNFQWSRKYGTAAVEVATSILQTPDGGVILFGYTNVGVQSYDLLLMKLDDEFNVQWEQTYGGEDWETSAQMIHHNGGGYILLSKSYSAGDVSNIWILHVNEVGAALTSTVITMDEDVAPQDIVMTPEGEFVVVGSYGADEDRAFINYLDNAGVSQWTWIGDEGSAFYGVIPHPDGFVGIGEKFVLEKAQQAWVYCFDADQGFLWEKFHGGEANEKYVGGYMADNKFYAVGTTESYGAGGKDIYFSRINLTGTWLSGGTIGKANDDEGILCLWNEMDEDVSFFGYGKNWINEPSDFIMIYSENEDLPSGMNLEMDTFHDELILSANEEDPIQFSVYPNPFANQLTIDIDDQMTLLMLRDAQGRICLQKRNANIGTFTIDTGSLSSGLYFLELHSKHGMAVKKLIKQ